MVILSLPLSLWQPWEGQSQHRAAGRLPQAGRWLSLASISQVSLPPRLPYKRRACREACPSPAIAASSLGKAWAAARVWGKDSASCFPFSPSFPTLGTSVMPSEIHLTQALVLEAMSHFWPIRYFSAC